MRCLYCGKELALFKRLRGGEFCSDAHRQRYQEEYTQLALNRLLQANTPKEGEGEAAGEDSDGANLTETHGSEPDSPALKRREKFVERLGEKLGEKPGREHAPAAAAAPPKPLIAPVPASVPGTAAPAPVNLATPKTAVLDHEPLEPAPPAVQPEVVVEETPDIGFEDAPAPQIDEPAPAAMSSFMVEVPVPAVVEPPAAADTSRYLSPAIGLAFPRLREYQPDRDTARLDPAERITLTLFTLADCPTPPRERGLELREFVRGTPPVEIHVKPAVESGFEPATEALEVSFDGPGPEGPPSLWFAPELDFPAVHGATEILLGELARLDFALTEWGPPADEADDASQSPRMGPAGLEPMRMEPMPHQPSYLASTRPEPLHFEPVHIDPVFMEKIAGTAGLQVTVEDPAPEAAPAEQAATEPVAPEPVFEAPPSGITKPLPVTLHGLAPVRGKPVQVFSAGVVRSGDLQVPRATGLPLRPVMLLGPAVKPASVEPVLPRSPERPTPAAKSVAIPEKHEPRPETKLRKPEVRVLPIQAPTQAPIQAKEQPKPESTKPAPVQATEAQPGSIRPIPDKPVPAKSDPVKLGPAKPAGNTPPKPEPVKEAGAPAARLKEASGPVKTAASPKPAEPVKPAEAVKPVELVKPSGPVKPGRVPVEIRASAPPMRAPAEELDLLGLPKLSFQQKETFWSKLPGAARLGLIAAALALIVGGVVLTSRGSGSAKPAVPVSTEPVMLEEPAMANTAGWEQDWFADRAGAKQGRHVDVLRGTLALRDYRLLFEGQIEHGALGWVFRATDKSFYVEKIEMVTPGLAPVMALVRFAVINGVEQPRVQVPLALKAHLDTTYKVRMDVIGDSFATWVQDEKVDQWKDSQLAVGGVGLYYDANDSAKLRDTLNVIPLRRK